MLARLGLASLSASFNLSSKDDDFNQAAKKYALKSRRTSWAHFRGDLKNGPTFEDRGLSEDERN